MGLALVGCGLLALAGCRTEPEKKRPVRPILEIERPEKPQLDPELGELVRLGPAARMQQLKGWVSVPGVSLVWKAGRPAGGLASTGAAMSAILGKPVAEGVPPAEVWRSFGKRYRHEIDGVQEIVAERPLEGAPQPSYVFESLRTEGQARYRLIQVMALGKVHTYYLAWSIPVEVYDEALGALLERSARTLIEVGY